MKKNKEQKWYPVEYSRFWQIQDCEEYNGKDMLDANNVGKEQAEYNAKLCASAPQWKEMARILYENLKYGYSLEALEEDLKQYEQLIEEENGTDRG